MKIAQVFSAQIRALFGNLFRSDPIASKMYNYRDKSLAWRVFFEFVDTLFTNNFWAFFGVIVAGSRKWGAAIAHTLTSI